MGEVFSLLNQAALTVTDKADEVTMEPVVPPDLNEWARADYHLQYTVAVGAGWDTHAQIESPASAYIDVAAGARVAAHLYTEPFDKEAALGSLMFPVVGGRISMHFESVLSVGESGSDLQPPLLYSANWQDCAALEAVLPIAFSLRKSRVTSIVRMNSPNVFAATVDVLSDVTVDNLPPAMLQSLFDRLNTQTSDFLQRPVTIEVAGSLHTSQPFSFLNESMSYDGQYPLPESHFHPLCPVCLVSYQTTYLPANITYTFGNIIKLWLQDAF